MEEATIEKLIEAKGDLCLSRSWQRKRKGARENSTGVVEKTEDGPVGKSWLKRRSCHDDMLRGPASAFRRSRIVWLVSGSDCKRGSQHFGAAGLSRRHVSHDAYDDEGQKLIFVLDEIIALKSN